MNLANKLVEKYNETPDKICIIQNNRKITFKDLYNKASNFKRYLEQKGIKKGQKILILIPMSIELYSTLFALWSIGAIPCFMDSGFIKNGMKKNDFNEISGVIGITKYILYSNINPNLRKLKLKINTKKIENLNGFDTLSVTELEENFSGIYTYTSGTTGKPKIASRTHEFLNIQGEILYNTINYNEDDIELSTMPIFTLSNINAGITTVIADGKFTNLGKSNPQKLVNQIIKEKITRIMAAPGILNLIVNYCLERKILLNNINEIMTGGGAIFLDLINKLKKVFPNGEIITAYGSTEAEPIAKLDVTNLSENYIEKIKNGYGIPAGQIIGVDDCQIISTEKDEIGNISKEEFEKMKTNSIGEIVVAGKNVLGGYVNGIGDKENKFSVDGIKYHRTGDMGIFDSNGELWLRGRKKEPYFNIEAALHAYFNINRTAVFVENGKIILVLEKECNISSKEIKEKINFTKIDEIKFVDQIPTDKRHSSKVDYNELKKLLK